MSSLAAAVFLTAAVCVHGIKVSQKQAGQASLLQSDAGSEDVFSRIWLGAKKHKEEKHTDGLALPHSDTIQVQASDKEEKHIEELAFSYSDTLQVQLLEFAAGKPSESDAVDATVVKTKTEMVMPSYVRTEQYPISSSQKIGGSCVCQLGDFFDPQNKTCVKQKAWGKECGSFPKKLQHLVCQDGLVCRRWDVPDNYKPTATEEGKIGTAPITCDRCKDSDGCKEGQERHDDDCVREGDVPELTSNDAYKQLAWENDDMLEAWGGKASDVSKAENAGQGRKTPLVPFGRAEPKMCVTVQVTVPRLTINNKSTRAFESEVTTPLKIVMKASKGANASATATARVKRRVLVKAQAAASASSSASAAAEASYTAYASATRSDKSTHEATVKAQKLRDVAGTGHKARITTEATATSKATREASAIVIANATRNAKAVETAGVDITVTQTGMGDASAVVEKNVTVTISNWTEVATRSSTVNATGVGSLTEQFWASATAKAVVESKACISAHQARKLLGEERLDQSGTEFARSVYIKAQQEAYAQAKVKGFTTATAAATKAARRKAASDIEEQVRKFASEHEDELNKAALTDAWESTKTIQKKLKAEAEKEASAKAQAMVKRVAAAKAKQTARRKAKREAEIKATELAKKEAQKEARKGIEAKTLRKAKTVAQETADSKAKAKALKQAKKDAQGAAKTLASDSASDLAKSRAQKAAKSDAEKKAAAKASEAADKMAGTGAKGVVEEVVEDVKAGSKTTELAKKEAKKEARNGIEAKALRKAKNIAQDTADSKAKGKALKQAEKDAQGAAKALASDSASDLAKSRAQKAAKSDAEKKAAAKASEAADKMAGTGAEGAAEDVVEDAKDLDF
eukprot:TRINITY_DN2490_c0_g1_i1.p1 TRINITY_DN2490_c0_g1~~TRINITY_DN2490_c0_g1_i1.p1  ORF type:complete len:863 (+),score=252.96 TRINITY_DN2490_c0_g1_i1:77-2665(+)